MIKYFETNKKPIVFFFDIEKKNDKDEVFYVKVRNINKRNTYYIDTYVMVNKSFQFILPLPISPNKCEVSIKKENDDDSYDITKFDYKLLRRDDSIFDFDKHKEFIDFNIWFSENAGILSAENSVYGSANKGVYLVYADKFEDSNTPSRIDKDTKVIQSSKDKFITYTVGGRFGINGHEYGHCFMNNTASDEQEADFNSLKMFLGMGFPKIEAINVWCEVFKNAATEKNLERYQKLKQYILNYKSINY